MILLLTSMSLAAPAGWEKGKSAHDCTVWIGPEGDAGINKLSVECVWPEADFAELDDILGRPGDHDDVFGLIVTSTVVNEDGDTLYVKQVHNSPPLDKRELVQQMGRKEDGETVIHWWKKAPTQPAVADGHVNPDKNSGQWVLKENPAGGVFLTYELDYEPGGSVPSFVIRAFQGGGVLDFLGDLRAWIAAN